METCRFLALDLGGTNFRVLLVEIGEARSFSMDSKVFSIPKEVMTGSGDDLFDHIADCLAQFVKEHDLQDETLPLGFTFSFPCKQEGLAKVWTHRPSPGFNHSMLLLELGCTKDRVCCEKGIQ